MESPNERSLQNCCKNEKKKRSSDLEPLEV